MTWWLLWRRMMEKNAMLDQLYSTLKELKQQYKASREVRQPCLSLHQLHVAHPCKTVCNHAYSSVRLLPGGPVCCERDTWQGGSHQCFGMTPRVCLLQEAARAAAGLEQAQARVQQHEEALEEAGRLQGDASAALVSLSLRCEGLADTLASESATRQVGNAAKHAVSRVTRGTRWKSQAAECNWLLRRMPERHVCCNLRAEGVCK